MNDYPEIRASLVKFARGTDRPMTLKAHAEVLIAIIDGIAKDPDDPALSASSSKPTSGSSEPRSRSPAVASMARFIPPVSRAKMKK